MYVENSKTKRIDKMKKSKIAVLPLLLIFAIIISLPSSISVFASGYSSDYRKWSQGASADSGMRRAGCWIVAQAKLIYEAGIDRSAEFNPDSYLLWERANGFVGSNNYMQYGGGKSVSAYASSKGKSLDFLGMTGYDVTNRIWSNIQNGYYTIVKVWMPGTGDHYVMIANELSKQTGKLCCYNSNSNTTAPEPSTLESKGFRVTLVYTYSSPRAITIQNEYYGHSNSITENSAVIQGKISKPEGPSIEEYGLRIAKKCDTWESGYSIALPSESHSADTAVHLEIDTKEISDCSLRHATEYKYQFFTKSEGETYWGLEGIIITAGSHSFGEWIVTNAATCSTNGSAYRKCSSCQATESTTLYPTAHSFSEWKTTTPPTESSLGEKERSCLVCGFSEIDSLHFAATDEPTDTASDIPIENTIIAVPTPASLTKENRSDIWLNIAGLVPVAMLMGFAIYFVFIKKEKE